MSKNNGMILIFWGLSLLASGSNFIFNLQAVRILTVGEIAILNVFLAFHYLLSVPANALAMTMSRFTAYYSEKGELEKHFYFLRITGQTQEVICC